MPAEQLAELFSLIEGGAEVAADNIVSFPTDVVASGAKVATGVTETVTLGNGAAAEITQLATVEAGAATGTTTGVGLLAIDSAVAGTAIGSALGLAGGIALYNLAPDFWTNVSNQLVSAGKTIGGKVRAYLDGDTKQVYLDKDTIEIFKNAYLNAGLFTPTYIYPEVVPTGNSVYVSSTVNPVQMMSMLLTSQTHTTFISNGHIEAGLAEFQQKIQKHGGTYLCRGSILNAPTSVQGWSPLSIIVEFRSLPGTYTEDASLQYIDRYTLMFAMNRPNGDNKNANIYDHKVDTWYTRQYFQDFVGVEQSYDYLKIGGCNVTESNNNVQKGATLPQQGQPISETYPGWESNHKHIDGPDLDIYPIELPVNNPDATQEQAQNPDPNPVPGPWLDWLLNNLNQPEPDPNIGDKPVPDPDPDPVPEPDPIPVPDPDPVPPDPPDPNPIPPTPPLPVVPPLPATVDSNAMFTVYAPSLSQLNSFGGWLWNSSIIEQILRMWQNPLDGIIAFMKVYAVPTTGTSKNIQVGYLDSGVSAPVVTSQFVTVDCGSVEVNERKHNATDYTPYVSLHLYLPFIGIVELDSDEFMDGTISVKYSIDVYTGTCLAEVKCTRSIDMPNATILYTFSGNASQQLPLTSANFAGALSSLVSAVGGGIMIASGGAVGGIAGAAALGHSLTHEMVHVGHSGALSSNAGIMASRKPYLIISRRHAYDANNYATEYGYPANKAVYLGNCSGFTRVKAGHLKCKADSVEKEEIMALLEKGVLL